MNEHPVCVCYNWHTLHQSDKFCFVVKDFTLKSPFLDLRNELAGTLPREALKLRIDQIQSKADESKRIVLERHHQQISELANFSRLY